MKTHGLSKTRPYRIWSHILNRCNNSKDVGYDLYGGRGITVCDRWLTFENFWEDMKQGYADSLSIDRINNNGNYEIENCRWATAKEQRHNRRLDKNARLIIYNGQTKTLMQWSKELGMGFATLRFRIDRWPIERAMTEKLKHYNLNK